MLQKPLAETAGDRLPSAAEADDEIDLAQLAGTLWRGKWIIAFCTALAVLLGGYYAFALAVPKYTATAVVALESRQEQVVDLQSVVSGLSGDQAVINTEVEVIRSRRLIERVVDKLKLTEDPEFNARLRPEPAFSVGKLVGMAREAVLGPAPVPPPPSAREVLDATIDAVLNALSVSNIRNSYVFRITAVTQNPEKSARIANTLADVYIGDQLQSKFEATEQASAWLSARVAELKTALEKAEAAVKEFDSSTELVSPEALEALNRQVKDLRERIAEMKTAHARAQSRLAELEAARNAGDRAAMAKLASDRTLDRILDLINSGSGDPATFDARYDQIVQRARLEADRAASQLTSLQTSLTELEERIAKQSQDLLTLQQLRREAEANRLIYESFLTRLKEISVQQGIQQADSRVLSAAVVPDAPSAPRKPIILSLAMFLGLMGGSGLVLGREMLQNTFRTAEELEQLTGVTVMGQIPLIPARRRKRVLQYLAEKPSSPAAEAIRNLRTSVLLSNVDSPPQVIMSTSSIPGEGKTTLSIALAQNFGGLGKRVLLVEGDIRRRTFGAYFDISESRGLLAVLSGEVQPEDVVIHDQHVNADILLGEKSSVNAADVFSSESFERFLTRAREAYDVIIIDTPPVLVVPDARVIGQSCDAILYTVKWDSTSKNQVREGLRLFSSVNLRVTGAALNAINPAGMKKYGYGDRYGAYSHYGKGYYDK